MQGEKTVTAHLKSEQLLHFAFVLQHIRIYAFNMKLFDVNNKIVLVTD